MRSLVTGAAGFIGSTLSAKLLDVGHEVIGVDGFYDNYAEAKKRANLVAIESREGFRLVEGYLQDLDLPHLLEGVDRVFHIAALPGVRASWGGSFEDYSNHNVYATQLVLEASREAGVPRVVYASSSSVYGDAADLPMRESVRERPFSPYGVTKLAGEHLARLYSRNYGLHTVSLRFFTVYGPRQRPDMAIQRFLTAARDGTPITLFGDGEQTRDFTYVDDVVEMVTRAGDLGASGAVYNVGGGSTITVNGLIGLIEQVSGRSLSVQRRDVQHGDVLHTCADAELARRDLQFTPATSLPDGLARHWQWLQTNP